MKQHDVEMVIRELRHALHGVCAAWLPFWLPEPHFGRDFENKRR
jgi:hypothetical protein